MARIQPFKAIRPTPDKVQLVTSRSYVSYNRRELREKLAGNPFTFIHIINPETGEGIRTRPNSRARFKKVRHKFEEFIKLNIFQKDAKDHFYIYRQIKDGRTYTGLICGVSIDDYFNGHIKVHEQTITKRELMFRDYLDETNFNAEPVLLAYQDRDRVNAIIDKYTLKTPEWDYSTTDWARHQLWMVGHKTDQKTLMNEFSKVDGLYIADGHHRTSSSALLGQKRRKLNPHFNGSEPYNFCMSMLIPASSLKIFEFNRVVRGLNGLRAEKFLELVSEHFDVLPLRERRRPEKLHEIAMFIDEQWYMLTLKDTSRSNNPVEDLDARILTKRILSPILNIQDLKTDKHIGFIPGVEGLEGLEQAVNNGKYRVAFALFPVTFDQLKAVSDAEEIMPPKSTYIEPKLRSGLTIFELS